MNEEGEGRRFLFFFFDTFSFSLKIITLVEELSFALGYEFKKHLPSLIPQMLLLLQTDKSDLRRITRAVLHALEVGFFFHLKFPSFFPYSFQPGIIRLLELIWMVLSIFYSQPLFVCVKGQAPSLFATRFSFIIPENIFSSFPKSFFFQALFTMARLCKRVNVTDYASRIIHPLIRVLDSGKSDLHEGAIQALQAVASQLGPDYLALFHPMVQKVMDRRGIVDPGFSALVSRLESKTPSAFSSLSPHTNVIDVGKSGGGGTSVGGSSPGDHGGGEGVGERGDAVGLVGDAGLFLGDATVEEGGGGLEAAGLSKLKVNEVKLLKAWDSIHVSEKEDWRREDWSEVFFSFFFFSFFSFSFLFLFFFFFFSFFFLIFLVFLFLFRFFDIYLSFLVAPKIWSGTFERKSFPCSSSLSPTCSGLLS